MKAIGFFGAVFLSMLGFFVVATGEFERWLTPEEGTESDADALVTQNPGNDAKDGKSGERRNILDFDYWNHKLGRRNFTIRAELPQRDVRTGSRIDELERIQLANGSIQVPLYAGKSLTPDAESAQGDSEAQLKELVLEFEEATYFRSGGLAKGGRDIAVVLRNGKGSTNEGTEFHFEELLFTNVSRDGEPAEEGSDAGSDSNRFYFRSDKPVSIVNRYLEVHSGVGLRGEIGSNGIESVNFLPPVSTYLDPEVIGDFALGAPDAGSEAGKSGFGSATGAAPDKESERETDVTSAVSGAGRSRAIILSQGPLSISFRGAGDPSGDGKDAAGSTDDAPGAGAKDAPTRIRFRNGVVVYNATLPAGTQTPPKPSGNRFECQDLLLEIDDHGDRPLPRRALATWEGGQVRTLIVRGNRTYVLAGDRLEWINLAADGKNPADGLLSEGYLTGNPTLRGPDVEFGAERAVLRPSDDTVVLEQVEGTFRRERRKEARSREGSGRAKDVVRSELPGSDETKAGADVASSDSGDSRRKKDTGPRLVDFSAPRVEVIFAADPESGQKGLSRFVARGDGPSDVSIRSRFDKKVDDEAVRPFEARGRTLTYDANQQQATLEGVADQRPRLTQGESWIEARSIHLLVDAGPQAAWFQDDVRARIDPRDFAERGWAKTAAGASSDDDSRTAIRILGIEANYLGLALSDRRELTAALARGTEEQPVRLETLSGVPYRFFGREARLEHAEKVVELLSGDAGPEGLARMEMPGGVVRARTIRFEQETRVATLDGLVELELREEPDADGTETKKASRLPQLTVRAANATVEILDRAARKLKTKSPAAGESPISALRDVKSLVARGSEETPLVVESASFDLRGEEVKWDAATRRLIFSGAGLQEVVVRSETLEGPVHAREIIFDEARGIVLLQTSVRGELRQPPKSGAKSAGLSKDSAMAWEFETNALEIALEKSEVTGRYTVASLNARDKVLLYNPNQAVLLRGDDLVYDSARQRVEVFSRDGRRQTLQHFKALENSQRGLDAVKAAGATDPEGAVDTIHAQRIVAYLMQNQHAGSPRGRPRQMLLVQFRKEVLANFYMPGRSGAVAGGRAGKHWQLIAQRLTLHVDPSASARGPQSVPWALATGSREGAQRNVTINTGPYQAFAERAELQAIARQLVLSGSPGFPVTVADRRPGRSGTIDQEKHSVIVVRKVGDEVIIDSPRRAPSSEPWPGVPDFLEDE